MRHAWRMAFVHSRNCPGFTLLELMVTLGLVAVLMAAATPSFRAFAQNLELRAATDRLASDLRYARHAAVDQGNRVAVCPGNETTGCSSLPQWEHGWLVFADDNGDRNWQSDEPLFRASPPLHGISARSSAGRRQISFFANSSAPGSNVTVWLCDGRGALHGRQVRVSLAGRIRTTSAKQNMDIGGDIGC